MHIRSQAPKVLPPKKNTHFSRFCDFREVISCRIKPNKFFFLFFLVEFQFQLHFTGFLKVYVTWVRHEFFAISWTSDLGKKIFTTWNVLKSEVYLTCINFWNFHDDLKACLEVIRLPSWPENVEFSVKMHFFVRFWPPEKSVFKLVTNLEFSFSESGPGSVHIFPKPIFLFKFSNF